MQHIYNVDVEHLASTQSQNYSKGKLHYHCSLALSKHTYTNVRFHEKVFSSLKMVHTSRGAESWMGTLYSNETKNCHDGNFVATGDTGGTGGRHHNDVIMRLIASQITSLMTVYSTVYSRRRSIKTSKLRVTGLCAANSPVTGEFLAQRASNAENVSIRWRHHGCNLWLQNYHHDDSRFSAKNWSIYDEIF